MAVGLAVAKSDDSLRIHHNHAAPRRTQEYEKLLTRLAKLSRSGLNQDEILPGDPEGTWPAFLIQQLY